MYDEGHFTTFQWSTSSNIDTSSYEIKSNKRTISNINYKVLESGMDSNCSNASINILARHDNNYMLIYRRFTNIYTMEYVFMPLWLLFGIPGAALSFYVWSIRRQQHSSSLYLIMLAVNDLLFFLFHSLYYLNNYHNISTIDNFFMCKFFPFFNMILQYSAILLTFGFTLERYISVCNPFLSNRISSYKTTVKCCTILMWCCVLLSSPKLYFYSYEWDVKDLNQTTFSGQCKVYYDLRSVKDKLEADRLNRIMFIYEMVTEILLFAVVPLNIFVINCRVIFELISMRKRSNISNIPTTYSTNAASTPTLLIVSFYLLCATIPATVFQLLKFGDLPTVVCLLDHEVPLNSQWQSHLSHVSLQIPIDMLAKTYYAAKFYIYMATSQWFRGQFKLLFKRRKPKESMKSRVSCTALSGRASLSVGPLHRRALLDTNNVKHN